MSSCFGRRKRRNDDTEPLLPQYNDDTALQRRLHQKLHSYQMLRALSKGYMPSTEQIIVNLRTLLASDVLTVDDHELTDSGRLLLKRSRKWLTDFIETLRNKNDNDEIQDMLWFLANSRISIDTNDVVNRARKNKAKADTAAAYESVKTVGSLLMTNSDFRTFLGDLNTVGREVFKESAFALGNVAEEAGKQIGPSAEEEAKISKPGADENEPAPTSQEIGQEVAEVGAVVTNGTAQVAKAAADSTTDKLSGDQGKTLVHRLQQAISKLRQRNDYSDSVSTLTTLLKRYAYIYSRAASDALDIAQEDTHSNKELDKALANIWSFATSFGSKEEWDKIGDAYHTLLKHKDNDPEFEALMQDVGNSLQQMLTDPSFWDDAPSRFRELRDRAKTSEKNSPLRQDINSLLDQIERTVRSVVEDKDISKLISDTASIVDILSPRGQIANPDLLEDVLHTFTPLLVAAIQYLPIPRLEVSAPEIDLLLENVIIEPGTTINQTSFLPYKLKVETYNDIEVMKHHTNRIATHTKSLVTLKLDGLSVRADEVGFWLRTHSGIFRFADEGIASIALDDRGMDIHLDVEIAKERLEQVLTLKAVRVHIHKLNYSTSKSKLSWLGWLLRPVLRPIIRKTLEKQLASAIADFFHFANRELLFARERLRATRISQPQDLMTFFKAIAARLTPEEDPDLYTRVGVTDPGKGVFKGVYAPGSIVKEWEMEGRRAAERVEDAGEDKGWRNDIFDAHVATLS
ncbi:hypothetical protein K431DRAFT_248028 [Polychaeton citri CBS 116435]|uniref:HAM1-like N-terminal domain-containing protein n=1 Tax=Polychaeton citri CBS 116435 TaxID=1314669 RepID=A0A9P4Q7M2_9PEZI|nr:hypothetical protein K431DRAFT_248028 [Polychaeton citri CBS 116435]